MKYRKLRITWSVAWGVVAVLLCVLWVRSFAWMDNANHNFSNKFALITWSARGLVHIEYVHSESWLNELGWMLNRIPYGCSRLKEGDGGGATRPKFEFSANRNNYSLNLPHWFLVLNAWAVATLPWIRQISYRFSLRTLLIATTLIAVGLGVVVWIW